ncbi:MAG: hypothetical protein KJO07_23160 [Deltaproteobacteria bacterium]|nr:hypothetical protein [Deltaproteobacteria bacterium]
MSGANNRLAATALVAALVFSPPAAADDVRELGSERIDAGRTHLWRSLVWGGANVAGGLALTLASDRDDDAFRWGFGIQTTIWGSINVGIAGIGLAWMASSKPDSQALAANRSERRYHDILLFSLGLDIAYITAGTLLVTTSYYGLDSAREWRGQGTAIIIQGSALLVLEGLQWLGSRKRLDRLARLRLSAQPAAGGGLLGLTYSW